MLFGQLVCYGCQHVLTYPLGAISCRCRLCNTINAAQNLQLTCGACGQELHAPINTLAFLCPCCGTVTDIPEELLPPLPSCVNLGDGTEEMETTMYVSHPTLAPMGLAAAAASPVEGDSSAPSHSSASSPSPPPPLSAGRHKVPRTMLTREEREAVQETVDEAAQRGEEIYDEDGGESDPVAAARESVVPMRLAPTVMIATRIL
ncbi:hypothetical protein ABB37_07139 [Leptomonas pyrrhocoris]|uniref:Zinc finger LSD1-type domain-containing protein n=1 Tax=Leptomonas pyrrhocoris TaxID=157538 RepID=A0A0M9FW66_LEPPY|nr:hypothetical protein ABB37_07139 [Leptomonas pyrrhocoris]KPA77233.1 hypothetical protein ABB37_07139 [Leptomonas pyrrhocoris]|eukprot:XP_015655672.1 hypothetical protein ABB37_07139 [Leptomonas pyrrhocoris]